MALSLAAPARADTVEARCDVYPKGEDRASAVVPCTFSQRRGYVSIELPDGVRHELAPRGNETGAYVDEKGRPAYRNSGLGKRGQIFRLADKSIYVYWDTAGLPGVAPRAAVTGEAAVTQRTPAPPITPFERTLSLHGITFRVRSPNNASINTIEIVPSGLDGNSGTITRTIDGRITGAEVADLDVDGAPEVYVYVTSVGSGSYGSLVAYAVNDRKSLSAIDLPPVADNPQLSHGYMGHDQFAVVENTFVQRFPLYAPGDTNAAPTGRMRQLQYKLKRGEAGPVLRLDRVVEF